MMSSNRLAAAVLFALNLLLNWRILMPGASPYQGSIERGYAYMGRIFAANPDYLSWNPLQYCGIPMHYVYLPLLPYLDALLIRLVPGVDANYLHRALCALALLATPALIFFLVRTWGGNIRASFFSALATIFLSPLYELIETIKYDKGVMQVPWRIQALLKYGEGPHTFGIFLLVIAVIAVYRAATRPGFPVLLAAASALAATVLTNWVAGLALAFCVSMLMLVHIGDATFRQRRVIAAGGIGYLLSCFWLTPSFVLQMARNWPKDAFGFQFENIERISLLAWAAGLMLIRLAFLRYPARRYACWLALCVFGFGLPVALFYRFGINPFPESRRYALEYEIFLLLLFVETVRLLLSNRRPQWRLAGWALLAAGLFLDAPQTVRYIGHLYRPWVLVDSESTNNYRVAKVIHDLHPAGRVFASGGTRFRLNSWFDVPQTGGVFETGLKTRFTLSTAYQIRTGLGLTPGRESDETTRMLQALGVEYLIVHTSESEEYYRDFRQPERFESFLEKVWSAGGDAIYRVPGWRNAHVLLPSELPAKPFGEGNMKPLYSYTDAIRDPSRPALSLRWRDARTAHITGGTMPRGAYIALSMPWDPNWRAYAGGQPVDVAASAFGFMITGPLSAGTETLELRFEPSMEEKAAAVISMATALACAAQWWRSR